MTHPEAAEAAAPGPNAHVSAAEVLAAMQQN